MQLFNAVNSIISHTARLQLYQVHAVTEGTDAQAIVSVKMEENGKISTGDLQIQIQWSLQQKLM